MKKIAGLLKPFWAIICSYWNIYGALIVSTFIGWLSDFKKTTMDKTTSYLVLTLTCIGFLTFIKSALIKSKKMKRLTLEKAVMSQKSIKAINTALNPTKSGEELGQAVMDTAQISRKVGKSIMKKIKSIFEWVRLYWQQLFGLVGTFLTAVFTVYLYISDHFKEVMTFVPDTKGWQIGGKIAVGVISFVLVLFSVRNQVKWVGVGSITTAQDYLTQLTTGVTKKLSAEAKKQLRLALAEAKKVLKQLSGKLTIAEDKYNKVLAQYNTQKEFVDTLVTINASQEICQNAQGKLADLQTEINASASELNALQVEVAKFEKQVEDYEKALGC